ncbi:MAG: dipeptidase [Clostridia bacterium]
MFTADAHCDTLYYRAILPKKEHEIMITPARLAAGHVGLQTFAMFSGHEGDPGTPYGRGLKMLDYVPKLGVPVITGKLPDAAPDTPHGVLSIEGGEMLEGSLARLHEFHDAGVRMITLTWNYENQIAYPAKSGSRLPLKDFGRELVFEMDKLGMLSDVSHLNDAGFDDVAARTRLPLVASHSNLRERTPVPRNLTRAQVRVIIEKQGFIGVNFYADFLRSGAPATLDDVLGHIDALCELGAVHCVGFGSDFDGIDAWPEGLENPSHFPALLDLLARHGYTDAQLAGIAGGNLWRVYKSAESAAQHSPR